MDLNYVLTLSDKVKLVTEPIEDKDILQNFKAKYGGVEVYKRAKTVWVGETPKVNFVHTTFNMKCNPITNQIVKLQWNHVNSEELKYSVDRNLTGLQVYSINYRNHAQLTYI